MQIAFMQTLMAEGTADSSDIVFLDMDVLIVDSLAEVQRVFACAYSASAVA